MPMMTELTPSAVDAYECSLRGVTATAPDGTTATIDECAWFQVSPCGCVSGVTMAQHGANEILMTGEAALRSMATNAADAKEDARLGYRMVLVRMSDYREHLTTSILTADCPHDPTWGHVRKTREVGGRTWTRLGSTEWTHRDADGGRWRLSKWGSYWHISPATAHTKNGMRIPGMGSTLDEALTRASAFVDELLAAAVSQ